MGGGLVNIENAGLDGLTGASDGGPSVVPGLPLRYSWHWPRGSTLPSDVSIWYWPCQSAILVDAATDCRCDCAPAGAAAHCPARAALSRRRRRLLWSMHGS